MDPRDQFAVNLQRERKKADITQEELGFRCDLHRTEISLLERARREPRLGTVVKLASALEISIERLTLGMSWNVKRQRFEFEE